MTGDKCINAGQRYQPVCTNIVEGAPMSVRP